MVHRIRYSGLLATLYRSSDRSAWLSRAGSLKLAKRRKHRASMELIKVETVRVVVFIKKII